jgi:uncharacterized membrane protein YbhN (UPF0104 family)
MPHSFLRQLFKGLQALVFVGALVAIVYLLKKDFEAESLRLMLAKAQLSWLATAVLVAFLGIILKAIRLKDLAANFQIYPTLIQSFNIQVISISLGIITPGRSGELSKMFLLSAKVPEQRGTAFWVMLVERLLDLLILTGFACFFLFPMPWMLTAIVVGLLVMALAGRFLRSSVPYGVNSRFFKRFSPLLSLKPLTLIRVSVITALAWVLDGVFQWCILASIGAFLSPLVGVGINAVVAIAGIFSLLPIGLGTVDLSALVLYQHSAGLSSEEIIFLLGTGRVLGLGLLLVLFTLVVLLQPQILAFRKQKLASDEEPACATDRA